MFKFLERLGFRTPANGRPTPGAGESQALHTTPPVRPPIGIYRPPFTLAHLDGAQRELVDRFADLYYTLGQNGQGTYTLSWLGFPLLKCPLDLWIYQELLCAHRPHTVIETGTASGGSALFLATLCDLIGQGHVISIDIEGRGPGIRPDHPRITYLKGSSTDRNIVTSVRSRTDPRGAMVILDSDHRKEHVLQELMLYESFVPIGGYVVVEDTNVNGHPSYPEFGPGPMEAVREFLERNDSFQSDPSCERFLLTMNPKGFLRRYK